MGTKKPTGEKKDTQLSVNERLNNYRTITGNLEKEMVDNHKEFEAYRNQYVNDMARINERLVTNFSLHHEKNTKTYDYARRSMLRANLSYAFTTLMTGITIAVVGIEALNGAGTILGIFIVMIGAIVMYKTVEKHDIDR